MFMLRNLCIYHHISKISIQTQARRQESGRQGGSTRLLGKSNRSRREGTEWGTGHRRRAKLAGHPVQIQNPKELKLSLLFSLFLSFSLRFKLCDHPPCFARVPMTSVFSAAFQRTLQLPGRIAKQLQVGEKWQRTPRPTKVKVQPTRNCTWN